MEESISQIQKNEGVQGSKAIEAGWSVEQIFFLTHVERLKSLSEFSQKEIEELSKGQDTTNSLHDLIAKINEVTDGEGKIKVEKDSELWKLLEEAKKEGVRISKTEGEFSDKERERLIDNISLYIQDLNVKNELLLQGLTRRTNEKYEMYTLTRMGCKAMDDSKKAIIRNWKIG